MWHGRLRPISGELPKGTYKFIRRTTVEYPTMADAMIETQGCSLPMPWEEVGKSSLAMLS